MRSELYERLLDKIPDDMIVNSPLVFNRENCFEWWFVEPCGENQPEPSDPLSYIRDRLKNFAEPVPEILKAN